MIPICMKPKRFVSSLLRTITKSNAVASKHPVFTSASFAKCGKLFERSISTLNLIGPRQENWWTGRKPSDCPGFSKEDGTLHSLPLLNVHAKFASRESIQNYFDNTWTFTELLFSGLQSEDAFYAPPYHDLRHPLIFYYGHPAALYINKLRVAGVLKKPINEYYESLFETGVDEMSWDDLSKNRMKWPTVAEVQVYRQEVYNTVTKLIQSLSDSDVKSINISSPLWSLVLGFEHERIHIETSSFLINEMKNLNYLRFPEMFPAYHNSMSLDVNTSVREPLNGREYPRNDFIEVGTTDVHVGKPRDFPTFGWDNEYGSRVYKVPAFKANRFKVSNGEFFDFVKENGYARRELWTDDGWKWRTYRNVKWPTFWERVGPQGLHHYDLRLIYGMAAMNWKVPISCNMHEATAFAKWKSIKDGKTYRVMSELEHRAIRDIVTLNPLGYQNDPVLTMTPQSLQDGSSRANTNLACGSYSPVDALLPNSKGFYDVQGNAWEWCIDWFCALPGFEIHPFYEDFSTPCFDGLHNVIMSGSFMSSGDLSSNFARFHFRPHFTQHASFRLVEGKSAELITSDTDAPGPFVGNYPFRRSQASLDRGKVQTQINQSNEDVSRNFGYRVAGLNFFGLVPFTTSITSFIRKSMDNINFDLAKSSVLEVCCGMGSIGFELSGDCKQYLGIEPDTAQCEIANKLLRGEQHEFRLNVEGDIYRKFYATTNTGITNVEFRNATPMCLPADLQPHDVIILNDCIDKLTSPGSLLGRLANARGICRKGGVVIILSNFQWNEDATPKSLWLGGYFDKEKNFGISASEALREYLKDDFTFVSSEKLPCAWHESTFKLQNRLMTAIVLIRN